MAKNIYVHFRDDRTKLFHRIISILKSEGYINKVGASVVNRDGYEYLKNQNDIHYDILYSEADLRPEFIKKQYNEKRIRELEKKYGDPLLNLFLIVAGRFTNDHDERKKLVQHWFDFYKEIFSTFDPDIFLTDELGHLSKLVPFFLVNSDWGKSVRWHRTRVESQYAFTTNIYDSFDDVEALFDTFQDDGKTKITDYPESLDRAKKYLNKFRSSEIKNAFPINGTKNKKPLMRMLSFVIQDIFEKRENDDSDYMSKSRFEIYKNGATKQYRLRMMDIIDMFDEPDDEDNIVYFPLHYQPEYSTLVLGQMYRDQKIAVKHILDNLPIEYTLYIKEHPKQIGSRNINYYKQLKRLPNTKLINPYINSHSIIQKSDLITTISGTAGLEAILLKTPAIVFGKPHYRYIPMVKTIKNPEDLDHQIYDAIFNFEFKEKEILRYLVAIFEKSFSTSHPRKISGNNIDIESEKISMNLVNFLNL